MQIIFPLTTRISASPTYEQPDFAIVDSRFHIFSRAKSTCTASAGKFLSNMRQPLSSASTNLQNLPLAASFGCCGNKRYNTLDFPTENRVPTGCFHPYWKPRSKGTSSPFTIPARFEICIYKPEKRCLHLHIPKRKNPHSRSSEKERKACGDFQCHIHRNGRDSCVTHCCGGAILRTLTRVPAREKERITPLSCYLHL